MRAFDLHNISLLIMCWVLDVVLVMEHSTLVSVSVLSGVAGLRLPAASAGLPGPVSRTLGARDGA